jgi:2-phospho-L-lactate guanylyltransferase (CobY/MobA/RfbA family)
MPMKNFSKPLRPTSCPPAMPTPREMLDRLDSRHDELIRKLDELNARIEAALVELAKPHTVSMVKSQAPLSSANNLPNVMHRRAA